MLNRRNARIKVMQLLYGFWQAKDIETTHLKKQLSKLFEQSYDQYLLCLLEIREIAEYSIIDADIKSSKLLPTDEDKNYSTLLAESTPISFLLNNREFNEAIKKRKLVYQLDKDQTKRLFTELSKEKLYRQYIGTEPGETPKDVKILKLLFDGIMMEDESFDQHIEFVFPLWLDDHANIRVAVNNTLSGIGSESFKNHNEFLKKLGEAEEFGTELLEKAIAHKEEIDELIAPKLENWDIDRIAVMDMLLLHLAITELLDFPTIPIKVTMNEYIDISKIYSTPKSKEFINGLLDKISKELKETDKIYKHGRGLKES